MAELKEKISSHKIQTALIIFYFLMILPIVALSYYYHPTPEDFYYSGETKRLGIYNYQQVLYNLWTGRYFANILICIVPIIFYSIASMKILILLLMLMFFYIIILLVFEITKNSLSLSEKLLFSLTIIFLYLYRMPSVSEGFFWLMSVLLYHISFMMITIFPFVYLRLKNTELLSRKVFYFLLSSFLVFAIAGTTEIGAALFFMTLVLLLIKEYYISSKINYQLLFFVILSFIGTYISFKSKGNIFRGQHYPQSKQFFYSLQTSASFLSKEILFWLFDSPLLVFTVLLIPVFYKLYNSNKDLKMNIFTINPFLTIVTYLFFLFFSVFVMLWSSGVVPYDRILNIIYFVFLSGWFYNVIVLVCFLSRKYQLIFVKLPLYVYIIAFSILAVYMFKENNFKTAFTELFNGSAKSYNEDMYKRYEYIAQSASDSCVIDSIKIVPKTFFLLDVTDNPEIFYNIGYQSYFKKRSITIKKPDK